MTSPHVQINPYICTLRTPLVVRTTYYGLQIIVTHDIVSSACPAHDPSSKSTLIRIMLRVITGWVMLSGIKRHYIAAYGDMCTHCMHREMFDSSTWVPRGRLISSLLKTGTHYDTDFLMLRWPIYAYSYVHRTAGGVVHLLSCPDPNSYAGRGYGDIWMLSWLCTPPGAAWLSCNLP